MPADSAQVADEVTSMLQASAASWNAGDLEGFLDDYTDDPSLAFVGSNGVNLGKEAVRERYRTTYWQPGAVRDSLRFDEFVVRPLGAQHALARGHWVLYQPSDAGDEISGQGYFTLVLHREGEVWRIIHDHSS